MDNIQKQGKAQLFSATTKIAPNYVNVDIKSNTDRTIEDNKSADSMAPAETLGNETKDRNQS